jgi:hypothetical protein
MTPLQALFHTTLQQEASMRTADKIITRLDAWGSQPAAPGTKRDPELAAILDAAFDYVNSPGTRRTIWTRLAAAWAAFNA